MTGSASAPAPRPAVPLTAAEPFHVLAKPSGPICNLDCSYCFYLATEARYPDGRFRMGEEVLDAYLRQVIGAHPAPEVTIAWQGGEPTLMGLDFFRDAVARADALARPGQRIVHTLQTNGTLLDDDWATFLAEHGFLVGLSIDGPPAQHDAFRVDKRGAPTSDRVRRAWDLLARHGVDTNVLCTVHAANQDSPLEVYRYFRDDLGARYLQFIPIVERVDLPDGRVGTTDRSVDPEAWGRFLLAVFDEWIGRDVGTVFVRTFDDALASWLGVPGVTCIVAETCGNAVVLEHDGDLFSCDHFVDDDHRLGNILTTSMVELVASPAQRAFGAAKREALPRMCRECPVRFACHGECPKNRFVDTPDGEPGLNVLCPGYLAFFTRIDLPMRLMADLVRRGRYADEVTGLLTGAPRNDLCPCGSGRKAKHCHAGP